MCISCNQVVEDVIQFKNEKPIYAKELGFGVWIDVPPDFRKASSYDGYQARNKEASISIKVGRENIEDILLLYDKANLDKMQCNLLEKSIS